MAGIRVRLYADRGTDADPQWAWSSSATTAADGHYELYAAPGTYRLGFADESDAYASEYYDDATTIGTATDVVVTTDAGLTADASLTSHGVVTGTITSAQGGPLADIDVISYQNIGTTAEPVWEWSDATHTDEAGRYQLSADRGAYRLLFADRSENGAYASEYYDDAATLDTADDVTVSAGATSTADAVLSIRGSYAGTVTAQGSGRALPGVEVRLFRNDGSPGDPQWDWNYSTRTDADGRYRLFAEPGRYRLGFVGDATYITEYYDNARIVESAVDLTASPGTTTTANAALAPRPLITGIITADDSGAALPNVEVYLYQNQGTRADPEWDWFYSARTDDAGRYELYADPGTYRLQFADQTEGSTYDSEYYEDAATVGAARNLVLTAGATVTASAGLARYDHITGTVTSEESGKVLPDVGVGLYRNQGTTKNPEWVSNYSTTTDASGSYRLYAPPGTYRLRFSSDGVYASEYYNNAATVETGTSITLTAGVTPTADAALADRGSISGTITDAVGDGLGSATVELYQYDANKSYPSWTRIDRISTDDDGHYRLSLEHGTYRLGFSDPRNYQVKEYYDDASTVETAADIVVTAGTETTADASLVTPPTEGSVVGTVTAADTGEALRNSEIAFYRNWGTAADPEWARTYVAYTDDAGRYERAAEPGAYRLQITDLSGAHVSEYYDDATTLATAVSVRVTVGVTTDGVDAELAPTPPVVPELEPISGPTISGTPTVGAPLTVTTGDWLPAPTSYAYSWLVDGVIVPGQELATFVPRDADVGKTVVAVVVAQRDGYTSREGRSDPVGPVRGVVRNLGAPGITGTAQVGRRLVAGAGAWAPTGVASSYQWLADGVPLAGATQTAFTVTAAQLGRRLSVRVVGTSPGCDGGTATSSATSAVTATPTIRLTARRVGAKTRLTARVTVPGLATVTGKATFLRGDQKLRTVTLAAGQATLVVPRRARRTTYTVTYAGASYVVPARAVVIVRP